MNEQDKPEIEKQEEVKVEPHQEEPIVDQEETKDVVVTNQLGKVEEFEKSSRRGKGRPAREAMKTYRVRFMNLMNESHGFRMLSEQEKSEIIGVSKATIYNWQADIPEGAWARWRDDFARKCGKEEIIMNDELTKKAMAGDLQAILMWKKFLGVGRKRRHRNL